MKLRTEGIYVAALMVVSGIVTLAALWRVVAWLVRR